ncbi:MAG: M1 family metallopeptidase, partial [bacterium]
MSADVRPSLIDLHLELDPERRDFRGEARYDLRIGRRKRSLRLHASGLRVSRIRLHVEGAVWTGRVETGDDETIELAFDRPVPAGGHRLDLAFRGRVRGDMRGLYRGETRGHPWLASQLCPTDARRLFPCFDEPAIKARHRIRVTAPRDQAVISNAPVELEAPTSDGLRKTVQFETTPPLSAYLIAVAVGPFEASPALRSGSTEIRVHTLPGRQQLATFAREAAAESLERLERWFDLPHPYPKVDLVALPDFAFGAMENAGAVFFRDSILLLDAAEASQADCKRAGEVIAHELSHMWFGNLVTMAWWNDLWLNESFATWMAYEIVDSWQPDWRIWLDFAHRREAALAADALASSHPIAPPVRNAEEAQENFDAITYTKGACVLRMLEHHLGAETFREGIRLYIRRHREASAEAADLWAALEEVSDHPIEEIVAPWILQTGFPLVSIRRRPRQEAGALDLQQARFLALPPKAPRRAGTPEKRRAEPHWKIPWIGRIGRGTTREDGLVRHLITRRSERLPGHGTQPAFLYGNANEAGFFRVEHDEQALCELIADCPSLSPIERIGLIGHQWALARAGRASIAPLLDLLASLGQEDEPEVLRSVEDVLGEIGRSLAPSRGAAVEERLRTWIAVHFGAQVDRLGLEPREGEDERSALRRARILGLIGGLARDETVERHCQRVARLHLETGRPLPRELADVILKVAAQRADAELQAALCDTTRRAPTPQARQRTLFALAEVESADGVARSLAACDDEGLAPLADRASLLAGLLSRRESAPAAWRHLQRRWSRLEKSLPPILLARLARSTARGLPPELADEVRAFFQRHPLAAGRRVS